jgi:hypothetical protein
MHPASKREAGVDDRLGAVLGWRGALRPRDAGAVGQHDCGADARAAEIDCDDGSRGQGETSVSIVLEGSGF